MNFFYVLYPSGEYTNEYETSKHDINCYFYCKSL